MTTRLRRPAVWLAAAAVVVMTSAACGDGPDGSTTPGPDEGMRIAGFDFAESTVIAELYAQTVESTGTPVVRLGAVGPREITFPALQLGLVDLVPEYLGTTLRRLGATSSDPNTASARAELDERLAPLGLTALDAAAAEDKNVVVVTAETARELGASTISELGPYAARLRFGGPPECPDRPLCLVGLRETYGLTFAEFLSQRSQSFTAEALRRGEIDVALMFSTDPELTGAEFVVLEDDRRLQPAENVVPVVRADALTRWGPDVAAALDGMAAVLTTAELRTLNSRVGDDDPIDVVVAEWLDEHDLPRTGR